MEIAAIESAVVDLVFALFGDTGSSRCGVVSGPSGGHLFRVGSFHAPFSVIISQTLTLFRPKKSKCAFRWHSIRARVQVRASASGRRNGTELKQG
jgi:hypothetical protein